MEKGKSKVLINNTIMMYILSITKLVIPLISLPYLTRVLSVDCYGSVSFVKSIISYLQILVDFGFLLSGTKDLIYTLNNKEETSKKIGNTLYAQLMLCGVAVIIMLICVFCFDILKGYELFSMLSLITVILTVFLFEYVFKAYEQMGKIAIRYVIMKVIALILTLIFVKGDKDIYLIPIFDILSSLVAIVLVAFQLKKLGIKCDFNLKRFKAAMQSLKDSFVYFISNAATTAFTALNTLIIGLVLTKADVAYWNVSIQLVCVIQTLYQPIINSVFPTMIKEKNLNLIHKIMLIYMPIILVGCILILILGDWVITFVFTKNYLVSSLLLKYMIPVLIFSFPAMLYGWPCLGAIEKQKETSISTIVSSLVQVFGLVLLILINQFTLLNICIVRCITEVVFCIIRMGFTYKNKELFVIDTKDKNKEKVVKMHKKQKKIWIREIVKSILGRRGRNFIKNCVLVKGDLKKALKNNIKFKNIHLGERCFILGNGPSIKNIDFKLLQNEKVFTVNQISRMENFKELKTNYHLWGDDIFFKPTDNDRMVEIMKAVKTETSNPEVFYTYTAKPMIDNYSLNNYIKINYFKQATEIDFEMKDKLDFTKLVPHCSTVVQYAIILAYYMGFKEIYLLGCECTGIMKTIEKLSNCETGSYYAYELNEKDKNAFSNDIVEEFFTQYKLLLDYEIFYDYLNRKGVKLVNCTDGGILKNIPCENIYEVLKRK